MFAYNLDVQNGATFNGTDIEGVGSFSTEQIVTGRISFGAASSVTISSGSITIPDNSSYVTVAGEGGTSDTLTDINGGEVGDHLVIQPENQITIADNVGNIRTDGGSDITIADGADKVVLFHDNFGLWIVLSVSDT